VARIIVLDAGPLGLLAGDRRRNLKVDAIIDWKIQARANGAIIIVPEIADYEVRRELLRVNAMSGVKRLNALRTELFYAPISTEVMQRAAELWAEARRQGLPTADDKALDGDVIVAAQAMNCVGHGDLLTVATDNARHLSRFLEAREWDEIDF
jgi:hypothetical protein